MDLLPVFITGHPKSGTSLLQSMFDGSSNIYVLPEETNFFKFIDKYISFLNSKQISRAEKVNLLFERLISNSAYRNFVVGKNDNWVGGSFDYTMYDLDGFILTLKKELKLLNKFCSRSVLDTIVIVTMQFINRGDYHPNCWVEKSPGHENYINRIFSEYPDAKIINLIRDPRDIWVSYKKKRKELSLFRFCYNWQRSVNNARIAQEKFRYNVLSLNYEKLVTSTEVSLQNIANFIQVEYDSNYMKPTKAGNIWTGNSMWGDKFTDISTKPIGRYKNHNNQKEIRLIESILYNDAKINSYSFPHTQKFKKFGIQAAFLVYRLVLDIKLDYFMLKLNKLIN